MCSQFLIQKQLESLHSAASRQLLHNVVDFVNTTESWKATDNYDAAVSLGGNMWIVKNQTHNTTVSVWISTSSTIKQCLDLLQAWDENSPCRDRCMFLWTWLNQEFFPSTGVQLTMWRCCSKPKFLWCTPPSGCLVSLHPRYHLHRSRLRDHNSKQPVVKFMPHPISK